MQAARPAQGGCRKNLVDDAPGHSYRSAIGSRPWRAQHPRSVRGAPVTREQTSEAVTLKIPRPLYERLKQVIQGSGFHSVTEFVVYVLRDLASHRGALEERLGAAPSPEAHEGVEPLSPDEIEAIRQRLSSLGYL